MMRAETERLAAASIVAVAALAVLGRAFGTGLPAVDFTPIWLAGRVWNSGADPYGPAFTDAAQRLFPLVATRPVWWVYPAQWALIARPIALLDYAQARAVWLAVSIVAMIAAIALLWAASTRLPRPPRPLGAALAVAFLLTTEAMGGSLFLGQTSALMLLGIALLVYGAASGRRVALVAGECLLLLKPQFGLVFGAAMLALPTLRIPLAVAVLASAAVALLGFAAGGDAVTTGILTWLGNLGRYNGNPFNAPTALTGLIQIGARVTPAAPPLIYTFVAATVAFVLVRRLMTSLGAGVVAATMPALWLGGTAALAGVAALHNYDLAFLPAILLALTLFSLPARVILVVALLVLHRARAIGHLFVADDALLQAQAVAATIATTVVLLIVVALTWSRRAGDAR